MADDDDNYEEGSEEESVSDGNEEQEELDGDLGELEDFLEETAEPKLRVELDLFPKTADGKYTQLRQNDLAAAGVTSKQLCIKLLKKYRSNWELNDDNLEKIDEQVRGYRYLINHHAKIWIRGAMVTRAANIYKIKTKAGQVIRNWSELGQAFSDITTVTELDNFWDVVIYQFLASKKWRQNCERYCMEKLNFKYYYEKNERPRKVQCIAMIATKNGGEIRRGMNHFGKSHGVKLLSKRTEAHLERATKPNGKIARKNQATPIYEVTRPLIAEKYPEEDGLHLLNDQYVPTALEVLEKRSIGGHPEPKVSCQKEMFAFLFCKTSHSDEVGLQNAVEKRVGRMS